MFFFFRLHLKQAWASYSYKESSAFCEASWIEDCIFFYTECHWNTKSAQKDIFYMSRGKKIFYLGCIVVTLK